MNCRRQSEGGGIPKADSLRFILEFSNRANRTEDLLLHDLHIGSDVGEDGRLDKVPLLAVSFASHLELRTGLLSVVDVP